jgi:hypothetical protein
LLNSRRNTAQDARNHEMLGKAPQVSMHGALIPAGRLDKVEGDPGESSLCLKTKIRNINTIINSHCIFDTFPV